MHSKTKAVIPSRLSAHGVPGENDTHIWHVLFFLTVLMAYCAVYSVFYLFQ